MKNMMQGMSASFAPSFDQAAVESAGSAAAPAAAPAADAGQAAASAAAPATPQAGAPTPSPSASGQPQGGEQLVEIKVGGKVEKVSLKEALDLAQQGRDYTRKTQQLADERNRFNADRQSILQQERANWLREQQDEARRRQADAGKDPAERALSQVEMVRQQTEDYLLSTTLAQVRAKYPDIDENQVLAEGMKRGISNPAQFHLLDQVAADISKASSEKFETTFNSRFDEVLKKGEDPRIKSLKDAVIAEYLKQKETKPAPVSGSGGTPSGGGGGPRRAKSIDEATDIARELLEGAKA